MRFEDALKEMRKGKTVKIYIDCGTYAYFKIDEDKNIVVSCSQDFERLQLLEKRGFATDLILSENWESLV